jgi:hypothetical protein
MSPSQFRWPTHLVRSLGLSASQIVAIGRVRLRGRDDEVLVPAQLVTAGGPLRVGGYRLGIVPLRQFSEVYVSVSLEGSPTRIIEDRPLGRGYYPAGAITYFDLPITVPRGVVVDVLVTGQSDSSYYSAWTKLYLP